MKIKVFENGVLKEEFSEDGLVMSVRHKHGGTHYIYNVGAEHPEDDFSPCYSREISVGGKIIAVTISTAPILNEAMEIMKCFSGMKTVEVQSGNAKLEIEV